MSIDRQKPPRDLEIPANAEINISFHFHDSTLAIIITYSQIEFCLLFLRHYYLYEQMTLI